MSTQTAKTRLATPGGNAGGASLLVEQGGLPVVAGASVLNFTGAGVTVTPGLPGVANIAIPGGGGAALAPEYHTITGPELVAREFTLSSIPTTVWADTVGGSILQYGVDFVVTGNLFQWHVGLVGLGLDGIIAVNDVIRVIHN